MATFINIGWQFSASSRFNNLQAHGQKIIVLQCVLSLEATVTTVLYQSVWRRPTDTHTYTHALHHLTSVVSSAVHYDTSDLARLSHQQCRHTKVTRKFCKCLQ